MTSTSFTKQAVLTASTKRATLTSGKRAAPTTNLPSLACTPLDPVDPELLQRARLDTAHEVLQTFVDGSLDIVEGDVLVVSGVEYPIRAVGDWVWRGSKYLNLIVENLKR